MKSVLISIQPYWVFLIIARKIGWDIPQNKSVEIRKTYPKEKGWNKKVIIYCTQDKKSFNRIPKEYQELMRPLIGKVIGEFVCDDLFTIGANAYGHQYIERVSCLSHKELEDYQGEKTHIWGWHISDLKIYDKPKELGEFTKFGALSYDDWLYGIYNGKEASSYENYLTPFKVTRPPQSWYYVEELRE